ncbi:adenylate cyclase [Striga asiatica]|uniref:Adenylate cyclase n=1 Tax=Striga asiatica TaxID=4170 RepID=A0A5A7P0L1_STRAF|nr:adenylate cyclase [Striga asiatica]
MSTSTHEFILEGKDDPSGGLCITLKQLGKNANETTLGCPSILTQTYRKDWHNGEQKQNNETIIKEPHGQAFLAKSEYRCYCFTMGLLKVTEVVDGQQMGT